MNYVDIILTCTIYKDHFQSIQINNDNLNNLQKWLVYKSCTYDCPSLHIKGAGYQNIDICEWKCLCLTQKKISDQCCLSSNDHVKENWQKIILIEYLNGDD